MIILNSQQAKYCEEAEHWFKYESEQLFQIDGLAGTGKSVLMYAILNKLGLKPYEIYPMAYTGQASIVMRSKGFTNARSIHSTLYEVIEEYDNSTVNLQMGVPIKKSVFRKRQYIDPNIKLFFIDEGYMVPESMVKDILSFGIKVIVCGDCHQLPPVGGKPGFLVSGKIHHLTELMRQSESDPITYIALRAMQGLPIHCGVYGNNVMVINDSEFHPSMIGFADCIVCGTNHTRDTLNKYVRQLAGIDSLLPRFGERVICRNNNWDLVQDGISLCNGLSGTVISQPDASGFNGKVFTMNFKPDLINGAFYDLPVNYDYFVAPFDEKQDMKNSFKRKYMIGEFFEFAYGLTTHLSQGAEYSNGIYIEEFMRPQIQRQLNYTGTTRFKNSLIYIKKTNKYLYTPGLDKVL